MHRQRGKILHKEVIYWPYSLCFHVLLCSELTQWPKTGILHLLQWMEKWQELEPVSLMTFSSTCRVLKPFGTKHADLRKALYDIQVEDTARVSVCFVPCTCICSLHHGCSDTASIVNSPLTPMACDAGRTSLVHGVSLPPRALRS
jgi:hypothetical protein